MVQVPGFLPTAPWRPEKLIGNIWLSGNPSAHLCISCFHPTFLFLHPSFPPMGAAAPDNHMLTPVWLQAVSVCMCVCVFDILVYGDRQGSQAPSCHRCAKGNVGRQAGIFVPKRAVPSGRIAGGHRRSGRERWVVNKCSSTGLVIKTHFFRLFLLIKV